MPENGTSSSDNVHSQGGDFRVSGPVPFTYEYPPAEAFGYGYRGEAYGGDPVFTGVRTVRRSLIVVAVGILAVITVLAAFSWFLSERSASTRAVPSTAPSVTSIPSPWGDAQDSPEGMQAPQLVPGSGASEDVEAARAEALALLEHAGFSRRALIAVLTTEDVGQPFYSAEAAVEAVDSLGTDWSAQARRAGQELIDGGMGFSPSSLYEFLVGEGMGGFTHEEASAGVEAVDADWSAEAVKAARFNLEEGLSTSASLLGDLEAEGFTREQASRAVEAIGGSSGRRSV